VRPYNPKSPTSQRPRPSTLCIEFDGSPPSYFARCCGSPDICSAKQQPNPFCFGILFPDKKDESLKVDDIALCQTDSLFVENRTAKLKILFIKNVTQCGSNILRFYVTRSHLKDNFTVCELKGVLCTLTIKGFPRTPLSHITKRRGSPNGYVVLSRPWVFDTKVKCFPKHSIRIPIQFKPLGTETNFPILLEHILQQIPYVRIIQSLRPPNVLDHLHYA